MNGKVPTWPQIQFDKIFNLGFVFEMKELSEISVKSKNLIDKTSQTHEMTYLIFFFFQVSKSKSNSRTRALTPNLRIQMNWFSSGWLSNLLPLLLQVIYIYFLWSDHFYSIRQVLLLHTTTNPSLLMMKFIIEILIDSIIVFFCQIDH